MSGLYAHSALPSGASAGAEYVVYYNQARPHQGIEQQIPDWYEQGYPLARGLSSPPGADGLHTITHVLLTCTDLSPNSSNNEASTNKNVDGLLELATSFIFGVIAISCGRLRVEFVFSSLVWQIFG